MEEVRLGVVLMEREPVREVDDVLPREGGCGLVSLRDAVGVREERRRVTRRIAVGRQVGRLVFEVDRRKKDDRALQVEATRLLNTAEHSVSPF